MTDSTTNPDPVRPLVSFLVLAIILWSGLVAFPASARADGDPASDVLATQTLFLPGDAGIPPARQGQLAALLQTTARDGYAIRVAMIASRSDLGSVTELWLQPQTYARFLAQELSLVYRGPLLVVMPNGLGLYDGGSPRQGRPASLTGVRIAAGGAGLAAATLSAIQRLAAASGHAVTIPPPTAGSSPSGTGDTVALIVFACGAALIALAWASSLRARPPRLPGRKHRSPSVG